jgi:hypothetical protein
MKVSVKLEEEVVRISFSFDPEMVDYVKHIPGRKYDPESVGATAILASRGAPPRYPLQLEKIGGSPFEF